MGNVSEGKSDDLPQDMIRSDGHLTLRSVRAFSLCVGSCDVPSTAIPRSSAYTPFTGVEVILWRVRIVPEEEEITSLLGLAWLREPEGA
jgi:hypothetical protein